MGELVKVMMFWYCTYSVELEGGERCKCVPGGWDRARVTLRQVVGSRGLDMVLDVL